MPLQRVLEPEVMDTPDEAMAYETMDHAGPNAAVVGRLVQLRATGRTLDLGTGPGHIPIAVCRAIPSATVVGVDLSIEMMKIAERNRLASPFAPRIEFQIADIKSLPFAEHSFDTVFSNTTLHHLPDPVPFLSEAWRVLKPTGVLLIRDLYRPPTVERRDELVQLHAGGNTETQKRMLRESLNAALTPKELLDAAHAAGMTNVEVTLDTDRHMTLQKHGASR